MLKNNVAIIIPSYNPSSQLLKVIDDLIKNNYTNIIVINDGSHSNNIFKQISINVIIINHPSNLGKGSALKSGFQYCLKYLPRIIGAITVDDDGQHKINDINKLYSNIDATSLILGTRNFNKKNIPLRSKFGNWSISHIISFYANFDIQDTQTGLRFIPYEYFSIFFEISGSKFEYETNMLIYSIKHKIPIKQINIETIYFKNNCMSRFKPFIDSIKILFSIFIK